MKKWEKVSKFQKKDNKKIKDKEWKIKNKNERRTNK